MAKRFCGKCGKEIPPVAMFCPNCGSPQANPLTAGPEDLKGPEHGIFCPNCGKGVPKDSNFCLWGGNNLKERPEGPVFCPRCGESNRNDVLFCESCGFSFRDYFKEEAESGHKGVGRVLGGRYELRRVLGIGGFGEVYLAYDRHLRIEVAIKLVPSDVAGQKRAIEQLSREARIAIRLSHPGIARLYNLEVTDREAFLVMEYVKGRTLDDILAERGRIPIAEAGVIMREFLAALAYAHSVRVIHRDVKPANIMVMPDGGIKVLDFGIAIAMQETVTRFSKASFSASSGTLSYMAPEQVDGNDQGAFTDVWAFGILAYEMLTGRPPFYRGRIEYQILTSQPKRPDEIPEDLWAVIKKCLEKDPKQRYQNAGEVLAALEGRPAPTPEPAPRHPEPESRSQEPEPEPEPESPTPAPESPASIPGSGPEIPRKSPRRGLVWGLGFVLIALLVAGFIVIKSNRPSNQSPAQASTPSAQAQKPPAPAPHCGDGKCNGKENCATCAKDCGCETNKICLNNRCITRVQAGKVGIEWVTIPGGSFQMGSNDFDWAKPVHQVTVQTFQMTKTEVTVAQYRACVQAGACTDYHLTGYEWPGQAFTESKYCNWGKSGRDNHPINCVDWNQAVAFAKWAGGRLPTEAEWEYAARSGGKSWKYPWGNEEATCEYAVMGHKGDCTDSAPCGCGKNHTWRVCSKPKGNTVQGLCDMAGNVWEWVQDWYHGSYNGAPTDGSAWESPKGSRRVVRGGGWRYNARNCRSANRNSYSPGGRYFSLGFRLCR